MMNLRRIKNVQELLKVAATEERDRFFREVVHNAANDISSHLEGIFVPTEDLDLEKHRINDNAQLIIAVDITDLLAHDMRRSDDKKLMLGLINYQDESDMLGTAHFTETDTSFIITLNMCLAQGNEKIDVQRAINQNKSDFIHEAIHYLDRLRIQKSLPYDDNIQDASPDATNRNYYNDPMEFNAHYQAMLDSFYRNYMNAEEGQCPRYFDTFFELMRGIKPNFISYLSEDNLKRLKKRLYNVWISLRNEEDIDGSIYEKPMMEEVIEP